MVEPLSQVHDLPQILLVTPDDQASIGKDLVQNLEKRGCLNSGVWKFDTKYYTADVSLVPYVKN